jgi:uridine phosphorylase
MITTITLTIALISSMVINIIFVWYTRKLLNYLEMTNDETRSILSLVAEYETHLTDVYSRDIFYGDATLESLLEHTNKVADEVQKYLEANEDIMNLDTEASDA